MIIDGRWSQLHILWATLIILPGMWWIIRIYNSWPDPAKIITITDNVFDIFWLGLMIFITLGLVASIIVPIRDGYSDIYLILGATGAMVTNLRIGVPECINGIHAIQNLKR